MRFEPYLWNLYKNSPEGQSTISEFTDREDYMDDVRLLERYNPKIKDQFKTDAICDILESLWCYKVSEYEIPETLDDAAALYEELVCTLQRVKEQINK